MEVTEKLVMFVNLYWVIAEGAFLHHVHFCVKESSLKWASPQPVLQGKKDTILISNAAVVSLV